MKGLVVTGALLASTAWGTIQNLRNKSYIGQDLRQDPAYSRGMVGLKFKVAVAALAILASPFALMAIVVIKTVAKFRWPANILDCALFALNCALLAFHGAELFLIKDVREHQQKLRNLDELGAAVVKARQDEARAYEAAFGQRV